MISKRHNCPNIIFNVTFLQRNLFSSTFIKSTKILDIRDKHLFPPNDVEIPALCDYLSNIQHIIAGDNRLNLSVFLCLESLQNLEIQNNRIGSVIPLTAENFASLTRLDLSANNIQKTIDFTNLSNLKSLQYLNLNFNGIDRFGFENPNGFLHLTELHLRGNSLKQFGSCFDIPQLRELNLAENFFDDLSIQNIRHPNFVCSDLFSINLSSNVLKHCNSANIISLCFPSLRLLNVVKNQFSRDVIPRAKDAYRNPVCTVIFAAKDLDSANAFLARINNKFGVGNHEKQIKDHANEIVCSLVDTAHAKELKEENYEIAEQEMAELTSGWENLPRPKNLRQCYQLLTDLVNQPKITVNALLPKFVPKKFPRRDTRKSTLFWNAIDRHRTSLQKNAIRIDRPAAGADDMFNKSKENNIQQRSLNKAMQSIKKLDNAVFDQVLSYRQKK
ncbi:uncharacterized protein LOC129593819 isoform X2 [Paramacrobiotus metropolitanus]|uniref:uncharacterized protein LOC129593819 isoform X2 n=1 Tax=Paramacrobiotus metropolitanus TaxID=2943436 RepID=UPI002445D891|nr:uncharacterized protein LOC129593819 isoform X2 [Paramacrobiotus metropolitanus]